jgi:hypothetical protein
MLRQSCYNNDGSERVFFCGKMSQNVVRGGEKSKAGEKGDGRCYCPCKKCCLRRPIRILITTATKHCIGNMVTLMADRMNIVPW